ncbi:hypothetical protein CYLTODRAFT_417020 [Cylindrobasidium torrendii FP15055 ss-10]|uniref:Methyltransferase domain-containing protein n=1 Tax=Cylindrobasidium torrendii FP15055 ss-10 TaxID=1314674 RepID=A0A0D7BS23_9AGAR|nr:hypothetical protein CYLTODRAFT_417020 [Cylindrobasidium torrendii FP15055 ss-10]
MSRAASSRKKMVKVAEASPKVRPDVPTSTPTKMRSFFGARSTTPVPPPLPDVPTPSSPRPELLSPTTASSFVRPSQAYLDAPSPLQPSPNSYQRSLPPAPVGEFPNPASSSAASVSSGSGSQTSTSFVFPSSRSRGHPSLTPTGKVRKFKFKTKKTRSVSSNDTIPTHLASATPPASPGPTQSSSSANRSNGSGKSNGSANGFAYPSARTRAHPNSAPIKFHVPLKKKKSSLPARSQSDQLSVRNELSQPVASGSHEYSFSLSEPVPKRNSFDSVSIIGSGFASYENSTRTPSPFPAPRISYPLDAYDTNLLEQDRLTTALLRRLNENDSPSFYHYGNDPPMQVLDLGCGQGHWMLEAATAWKGYGTRVTGLDMVDITKSLRPTIAKAGVGDNIAFVKGNFVKDALPFGDATFDLVRMANLTYAISFEKWEFVLKEVCRVLAVGGRLELIDDHVFFPYGTNPTAEDFRRINASTPEEDDADQWRTEAEVSRELESLFEHLNNMKYGIHLCPTQFLQTMLEGVFGHASEVRTMHLTLAPPEGTDSTSVINDEREGVHPLIGAPGLMLWPSTLIPMAPSELDVHALKHPRVLLSLKNTLARYAVEIGEDGEVDEGAVKESLWEYEGFLQQRFNPPLSAMLIQRTESPRETGGKRYSQQKHRHRHSVVSVSSITSEGLTEIDEYQAELRDHIGWMSDSGDDEFDSQSEAFGSAPPTPRQCAKPILADSQRNTDRESMFSFASTSDIRRRAIFLGTEDEEGLFDASYEDEPPVTSPSSPAPTTDSTPPPDYTKREQTHVRTFHVFEAIKMDATLLGAAL